MWLLKCVENGIYQQFKEQLQNAVLKISGRKIAVWGAGVRGILTGMILQELGNQNFVYIDSDAEKLGKQLNGHEIVSFAEVSLDDTVFILSMEYQDEVKKLLLKQRVSEKQIVALHSGEYDKMMSRLMKTKEEKVLVLGESICDIVPVEELGQRSLAEYVEEMSKINLKLLSMSCLGMELFFYLMELELYLNHSCRELLLLMDFRTLTSYNHRLPRVQKPDFTMKLKEYAENIGAKSIAIQLEESYQIRKQRAEDYTLENKYSLNRTGNDFTVWMKQYLDNSIMEELKPEYEEIVWLNKILDTALRRNIKTKLILQPINKELCSEIYGEKFESRYREKKRTLEKLASNYGAMCIDAGELLPSDQFVVGNTPNDALYTQGRQQFAKFIIDAL